MLSNAKKKLIRSLHRKKGRAESGLCLVEGEKIIEAAGTAMQFTFTKDDAEHEREYHSLVTTETPQEIAGVAKIPEWSLEDIRVKDVVVILDRVQDPGNVGTILRLCLAFDASLLLVESADVSSPKVVRSSAGALFHVPWKSVSASEAMHWLKEHERSVFRLEKKPESVPITAIIEPDAVALVAGNEGSGIEHSFLGQSVYVPHEERLESLNVASAVGLSLYERYRSERL